MAFILTTPYLRNRAMARSHSPLQRPLQGTPLRVSRTTLRTAKVTQPCMNQSPPSPPVDAPSGVLLILASVLAIASVGCVFELTGGHPQYGTAFTGGVLAVSLPGFLFFFYSAIRKGQQEALEDP